MIRHIVMYWLKESDNAAIKQKAVENFLSMRGKIPGLVSVEAGRDQLGSPRSCDLCLCTVFESMEALEAYRKHPVHLPVQAYMHSIVDRSASADFEVDNL